MVRGVIGILCQGYITWLSGPPLAPKLVTELRRSLTGRWIFIHELARKDSNLGDRTYQ